MAVIHRMPPTVVKTITEPKRVAVSELKPFDVFLSLGSEVMFVSHNEAGSGNPNAKSPFGIVLKGAQGVREGRTYSISPDCIVELIGIKIETLYSEGGK